MKPIMKTGLMTILVSLLVLGIVCPMGTCQAVSIGANPSSIDADVERGGLYNCSLYVFNLDKTAMMNCSLYVDDAYSSWVTFNKTSVTVDPDSYEVIEFELRPPQDSDANCSFYIYILGTSTDSSGTPISAGLKVPVRAELTDPSGLSLEAILAIVAVIIAGVSAVSLFALNKKGIIKIGKGGKK